MPAGGSPAPFGMVPDEIVPYASTETVLVGGTETVLVSGAGALLTAAIPELPEFMITPAAVDTVTLPGPSTDALMPLPYPFVGLDPPRAVMVPASSFTVTLPSPKLYARMPSPAAAVILPKLLTVTFPLRPVSGNVVGIVLPPR